MGILYSAQPEHSRDKHPKLHTNTTTPSCKSRVDRHKTWDKQKVLAATNRHVSPKTDVSAAIAGQITRCVALRQPSFLPLPSPSIRFNLFYSSCWPQVPHPWGTFFATICFQCSKDFFLRRSGGICLLDDPSITTRRRIDVICY